MLERKISDDLLECLTECGAQLHAELSIASDIPNVKVSIYSPLSLYDKTIRFSFPFLI